MKKTGILTSGGDCQSLNAAMRGVAKALYEKEAEIEIYGILDGYKGLIYGNRKKMKPSDFSGILTIGGPFSVPQDNPLSRCRFRMSRDWIRSRP